MTTWLEAPLVNWSKSSREANTLPQCKSSCEEQAGSDKNWSVKPYSLMSCCWRDAICKANQSTYGPFKSRSRLKLAHMSGPLELKANSCTRDHPILRYHFPPSWIACRTKARLDGHPLTSQHGGRIVVCCVVEISQRYSVFWLIFHREMAWEGR